MMDRKSAWITALLLTLAFAPACGDEVTSGGDPAPGQCDAGWTYNPITRACQPPPSTAPNNNAGNNDPGTPGNNDPGTPGNNDPGTPGNNDPGTPGNNDPGTPGNNDPGTPGNNDPGTPGECGPGAIVGRACAPSGDILAAAEVTVSGVDCDGAPFTLTTTTGGDGEFNFNGVPAGDHMLTVRTGSFENTRPIFVASGQTTDLTSEASKICIEGSATRIAVIQGSYDHIQGILDSLQLQYDIKGNDDPGVPIVMPGRYNDSINFLKNPTALHQYDILFINCGELWSRMSVSNASDIPAIITNLQNFVGAGKSLYVSDRAHPFIQRAFPDMIDFLGTDSSHSEAYAGWAPQTITASVLSPGMQTLLGSTTAEIQFPHNPVRNIVNNNWTVAEGAGAASTVHLEGPVLLCNGRGNTCSSQVGSVSNSPLLTSYKHPSGGTVIFTSFHNKAQADYNEDMTRIMRYLIFQL